MTVYSGMMMTAAGNARFFDPGAVAVQNWQPAARDGIATFLDRLDHSPFSTVFPTWRSEDDWTESFAAMMLPSIARRFDIVTAEGRRVRVLTKVLDDASPFAPKRRFIQRAIDRALTDFRARQAASPSPCLAVALDESLPRQASFSRPRLKTAASPDKRLKLTARVDQGMNLCSARRSLSAIRQAYNGGALAARSESPSHRRTYSLASGLVALVGTLTPVQGAAQSIAGLAAGARVRLVAHERPRRMEGTVVRATVDSIVIRTGAVRDSVVFHRDQLERLEVLVGRRTSAQGFRRGAAIGFWTGTAVAGAFVVAGVVYDRVVPCPDCMFSSTAAGAVAGIGALAIGPLIGGTVGALRPGERWTRIDVRPQLRRASGVREGQLELHLTF